MKLLFDENLSRRLPALLSDLFPDSSQVVLEGLERHPDLAIWDHAKIQGFTIVTTDADFFALATTIGPPPKVIWLRRWSHPTRDAEFLLRSEALRISAFADEAKQSILILERFDLHNARKMET